MGFSTIHRRERLHRQWERAVVMKTYAGWVDVHAVYQLETEAESIDEARKLLKEEALRRARSGQYLNTDVVDVHGK